MSNLLDDLLHNNGLPRQVTKQAFEVGKTVATTPGSVVFRNELLELIQYKPMSEKQYARPLLIVPPQINKYYIFDLSPTNSFVQCSTEEQPANLLSSVGATSGWPLNREWTSHVAALEEALNVCRAMPGAREVGLPMGACAGA